MLIYNDIVRRHLDFNVPCDDGAYRITTMYRDDLVRPDIRYVYKHEWHKIDGPAYIELQQNIISFNVQGQSYLSTQEYCKAAGMSDEETLMWVLRYGEKLPDTIEGFYGDGWQSMSIDIF